MLTFSMATPNQLPGEPGVYVFRAVDSQALYAGSAVNLRKRVQQHYGSPRSQIDQYINDHRKDLARMTVDVYLQDECDASTKTEEKRAIKMMEHSLIYDLKPLFNRQRLGKQIIIGEQVINGRTLQRIRWLKDCGELIVSYYKDQLDEPYTCRRAGCDKPTSRRGLCYCSRECKEAHEATQPA